MTKFEVTFLVVFFKTIVMTAFSERAGTSLFQQINIKTLGTLDDLFIALKIDQILLKSKHFQEYKSKLSLIQDAIYYNREKYKEIHDISKTNISHKIAYYISNINEVVDELIRVENVTKPGNFANDSNSSLEFVSLTRRISLNTNTIATITKLPSTKGSQDEVRRIFEGMSTAIKKYPFMVSVHVSGRFVCAGSLVHESLALSAASCLLISTDVNPDIQIRVASDYVSKMGYLVNIQETIFHPAFDRTTLANNLVILRTKKALRFKQQKVVAIEYDRAPVSPLTSNVKDIIILGWGRRKSDNTDVLEKDRPLSEGHLKLYDFSSCQYIYTSDFVSNKTFCAGFVARGGGACNHDAGGPALVANVLVGVISFGSPKCGATEAPTVFTRAGFYDTWIDSVFRRVDESPNILFGQQSNMSARAEIMNLDEELKNIYRENYFVDDVLYGPIVALNDNQISNSEFPGDSITFPDPKILASFNFSKLEAFKSDEIPDGYWRDYSIEEPDVYSEVYTRSTKGPRKPIFRIRNNISEVKQQNQVQSTNNKEDRANLTDYNNKRNDIETTSKRQIVHYPVIIQERTKEAPKPSPVSVLRENPNSAEEQAKPIGDSENQQSELKQPTQEEIKRTLKSEKAIVVLVESGTTEKVALHREDQVYHGVKELVKRILQAQALV